MKENTIAAENAYYDALYAEHLDAHGFFITEDYAVFYNGRAAA